MMGQSVAVNESGYRIGETHHRAKYSQAIVDRIRELREDRGYSYGQIVIRFHRVIPYRTIEKICRYEIRAQTPERYKRV